MNRSLQPPAVSHWLQNGFHRFLRPYLKRHFHAVAMLRRPGFPWQSLAGKPLIVYANHPSWWDPMIAHFLNRTLLPQRQFYAPIDAEALKQYGILEKLGFYGVRLNSSQGAASFLKQSKTILERRDTAIWITPEGRFCDVRDHSVPLMPGLAHLCSKLHHGHALPIALEYVFWEERLPVSLLHFGDPIDVGSVQLRDKEQWKSHLQARLRTTQSELAEAAITRDAQLFENLLYGTSGAGAVYDTFRRLRAKLSGKSFRAQHGDHFG